MVENEVSSQIIDRLILTINLIVFRVDAFMNNYIEFSFVIIYLMGIYGYVKSPLARSPELILNIITVSIVAGLIYSIVYVVNDFIDFKKIKSFQNNSAKFSFYALRPIIHFHRSISISIYLIWLYALYTIYIALFFSINIILFAGVLFSLSIVHSLMHNRLRPVTFFMLRMTKYLLLLTLLSTVLSSLRVSEILTITLPLIVPYTSIQTYFYAIQKNAFSRQSYTNTLVKICIFVSILVTFIYVLLFTNSFNTLAYVIVGYITVSPFFFIRIGLRKILGPENPDFHVHIKRLSLATLLTTCLMFMVVLVLSYLV